MQFAFSFVNKTQTSAKIIRKNRKKLLIDISMTISSVEHIYRFLEAFHKWMKMSKGKKNDGHERNRK